MTSSDTLNETAAAGESSGRTTREEWINLALEILISDGVGNVKVMNLAQKLNVSRSSFYWFFKSRRDLLDQLLHLWEHKNTASIVERAKRPAHSITEAVMNVFECWIDETVYDPRLDFAVREWARRSPDVRRLVDQADNERVEAISAMFRLHDYEKIDAFIRARVLYFMQVGYYALELREPMDLRLSFSEAYIRSFTGINPTAKELNRFRNTVKKHLK
ncbi:MAG: TetR/AcrR family transcriptional regulator [Hyphomicrobiales bacterium]|nr:TetR/AcrR family transcriptional regulator [Hyphomicrobiales bacterium]MCP4997600.1 TetR/AcrR family transcriptional regulator [Hyphomicrobiales bacterium]